MSLEQSFQKLFRTEYPKLCRFALSYMQDEQQAEDIVQETFIRIWEQKKDIIAAPNAQFYLITAVKNNCISAIRKQKNNVVSYTDQAPEPDVEPQFLVKPGEVEAEQKKRIAAALNQLPPKCREVFLLVKLHEMSYKQAAASLNVSVKTVENQMGKALRIFRELTLTAPLIAVFIILKFILLPVGVF